MTLCDSNVWLALALAGHAHHHAARTWLDSVTTPRSLLFCRATQQTLLRLLTNAAVFAPYGRGPLTNSEAWAVHASFLGDDRIVQRNSEPAGLDAHWRTLSQRETASPKVWMDSYLAAFAIAGSYALATTDAGFRQFDDLELVVIGQG